MKPQDQLMGQLPLERVSPDSVFSNVGVDYAGPFYIKLGHTRRPTIVKAYACLFVSLSVKAVHIEVASDLTMAAFLACLRRFVAQRGKSNLIWSDNGTNFVPVSSKNLLNSLINRKLRRLYLNSALHSTFNGSLFPTLWGTLGGSCVKHEDALTSHCLWCQADIRRTYHNTHSSRSLLEQ